jgi:hypothetical protein
MKQLTLFFALTFLPVFVSADELDDQINKACLRHAVSLVAKLKTDVVGELNQEQSDQALKIATDSCQAYFKKEFGQNAETIAAENKSLQEKEEGGVKDWLTEKILSGEVERKKGNERLRNLKH